MSKMSQRIHDKRIEYGYTMDELAEKIQVNKSSISKWENGDVDNIKRIYIARMAELFHVRPSWLMDMDDVADVTLTYEAEGKEPIKLKVEQQNPIIGPTSDIAQLYKVALDIKPENIPLAIEILKSLR